VMASVISSSIRVRPPCGLESTERVMVDLLT
jgi:hypothetical protein